MKRRDFCLAAIGACVFPFAPRRRRKLSERELDELVAATLDMMKRETRQSLEKRAYEYHYWLRLK